MTRRDTKPNPNTLSALYIYLIVFLRQILKDCRRFKIQILETSIDWSDVALIHEISCLSLIKDRLPIYIGIAVGRSELMELLASQYNAAKSTIKKDKKIIPLCLFNRRFG